MNAARQFSYLAHEEKSILRTLLYFDIFSYPLTAEEIKSYSSQPLLAISTEKLDGLVERKLLFKLGGFYSLQNNPSLELRRKEGNQLAQKKTATAARYSRLVASFPFVKAVLLSGSISKGYMDEKSDIDYFIVTDENRLWIVRTALALFRRIFLFNSHKNLCTNYFVDLNNLEIKEKNSFTAIEFCTLVPMYGKSTIHALQQTNKWVNNFVPNHTVKAYAAADKKFRIKSLLENLLPSRLLDTVNSALLQRTLRHWRRRYGAQLSDADFQIAFRSTPGISKSHPQFFQKKVLDRLNQKIKSFEAEQGVDLTV
jgi:predicted nucleotidyltransferase